MSRRNKYGIPTHEWPQIWKRVRTESTKRNAGPALFKQIIQVEVDRKLAELNKAIMEKSK